MAFKLPSELLQKVLRFKALQHKEGRLKLWGIPAFLSPAYVFVYQQEMLIKKVGYKKAMDIMYLTGKFQARQAFRMISKRFGYAKTIPDKKKLLDFEIGQGIVAGHGPFKCVHADFKDKTFIIKGISVMAEEYKRFYTAKKRFIDHFLRGLIVAFVEEVSEEKMMCIEKKCISRGNQFCEFVIKPVDKWDKEDLIVKEQFVKEDCPEFKELGAKIDPYLELA